MIYTAIVGSLDQPRNDITCFGDVGMFKRPVMEAKRYKILSHLFFDDTTIWVDGNIFPLIPPEQLVDEFLGDADMAVWKHPQRDCIYDEVPNILGLGGDRGHMVEAQSEHYKKMGHPAHWGLGECNVILRRNNEKVRSFCNEWWSEICRWSARDQMSFPYLLRLHPELKVNFIEGNVRNHPYFRYVPHTHPC